MFIDVHCHLDMLEKEGADLGRIIKGARKKRVGLIVCNSINSVSTRKSLQYSRKYPEVMIAAGIYPINALKLSGKEIDKEIDFIRNIANKGKKIINNKSDRGVDGKRGNVDDSKSAKSSSYDNSGIVAIGEVGIDHKWSTDKKEWARQRKTFEKFVKLSKELSVPVIVHSRNAEEECIKILEEEKAEKVIMHSFGGKKSLVKRIIDNGWYFSIPANVKNSQHFQAIVESVDLSRLFCETDSPYLHPDKKFPNEPANVVSAYEVIAKIKKLGLKEVEKKLESNFRVLFGV